jgi:hypothetical protein
MKTIDLEFTEALKFQRKITVQVDDDMEDWYLENILDEVENEYDESLGMDGLYSMLEENEINVIKKCREEYDSPFFVDISFDSLTPMEDDCDE